MSKSSEGVDLEVPRLFNVMCEAGCLLPGEGLMSIRAVHEKNAAGGWAPCANCGAEVYGLPVIPQRFGSGTMSAVISVSAIRKTEPPPAEAEPDSDESLRYLVDVMAKERLGPVDFELIAGVPVYSAGPEPADVEARTVALLKAFAERVREHERIVMRERPTRPDLRAVEEKKEA